jgi:GT2 family glycosyltransferase
MKQVSVVIVNYNVKHFLDQCLDSVKKACSGIEAEVWVVDNASSDSSVEMIQRKHPWVKLIESKVNLGFSKGNNLAIRKSDAQYILLLNPDTIIEENTLKDCIHFMENHSDAGSLGVKMIDGSGKFLPESKRGLPTPKAAFYKIFGLSRFFPKSKEFGRYHLSYLDSEKVHEVDVLSGAFMFIKKETLDKTGLLDEKFFMYGEDIDLSYRIQQNNYKNYYSPIPRIIHFKGESTKKNSLNYVKIFYGAMLIFYQKHFSPSSLDPFSLFIKLAIYLRAGASLINRFAKKLWPFISDGAILYAGMLYLVDYWEKNHRYIEGGKYPEEYLGLVVPLYIIAWISSIYINSGYDSPFKIKKLLRGVFLGTIIIAFIYAFLNESWRFSRALIILGSAWACFSLSIMRAIVNILSDRTINLFSQLSPRTILVGSQDECNRVLTLLNSYNASINYIGRIGKNDEKETGDFLGKLERIEQYCRLYKVQEIIFCSKDIDNKDIIDCLISMNNKASFKIVPKNGFIAIGSRNKNTAGELYTLDISWSIDTKENKRNKRFLDLLVSILTIVFLPILFVLVNDKLRFLTNISEVLIAKKSWIGFSNNGTKSKGLELPKIRPGVLPPILISEKNMLDPSTIQRLNLFYAKEFSIWMDIKFIWHNVKHLDYKS